MKRVLVCAAFALSCVPFATAQGPIGTNVSLKLDRTVVVGSQSLQPGEYTIRQLSSANNPRVLEFATDHGTKVVATVTANPLLQNTPPADTEIVFDNEGALPRISKIYVQGKDYGYEFPKEYSPARPAVAATAQLQYDDPNRGVVNNAENTPATTTRSTESPVAQNAPARPAENPAAQNTPARPTESPIAQNTPTPQTPANNNPQSPSPEPRTTAQNQPQQPAVIAQNTPGQNPTQQASPAAAAQQPEPAPTQANTQRSSTEVQVPATALGWTELVLAGLICACLGLFLYRRTA